jgi:serine protease AprX
LETPVYRTQVNTRVVRRFALVVWSVCVLLAASTPAWAEHRARLSGDLADHLAVGSQAIDVIVHGDQATVDALAARYNIVVKRRLKSGAVLRVNAGQLDALSRDEDVDHLSGDVKIRPSDVTTQSIGADQLWEGLEDLPRLTGEGITVAVIDSGIDVKHNALKNQVRTWVDFTGGNGADKYGHGTHVAATIAGEMGRASSTRDYRGVAPQASLINLRVLGDDGTGTVSDVVEALDWVVEHRAQYRIRVVNLSLGAPVLQPYRDDPLCEAVERAVQAGVVVVTAAGNFGRAADGRTILGGTTSPGNSPHAITVGALDTHGTARRSDDTVAAYSSLGPTRYDLILKPDLVAPGSHVVSAEASGSYLSAHLPERHVTGSGPNAYIQLSGTSMATAVTSGAVALLLQEKPTLKPASVKAVLQLTSSFLPDAGLVAGGSGSLDVLAAAAFVSAAGNADSRLTIAGEQIVPNGFLFANPLEVQLILSDQVAVWGQHDAIVWGQAVVSGQAIVWDQNGEAIIWGQDSDAIVWGQDLDAMVSAQDAGAIVWGQNTDAIVWGQDADAIVRGQDADAIVSGQDLIR